MLHAARAAPRRILFGRLKLTHEPHRSVERPAIAEVMLDLVGRAVRAHVAAGDLREAALEPRLGERSVLSQRHAERSEGAEGRLRLRGGEHVRLPAGRRRGPGGVGSRAGERSHRLHRFPLPTRPFVTVQLNDEPQVSSRKDRWCYRPDRRTSRTRRSLRSASVGGSCCRRAPCASEVLVEVVDAHIEGHVCRHLGRRLHDAAPNADLGPVLTTP